MVGSGLARHSAVTSCDPAQFPGVWPPPLPPRVDPSGDPAVLHRVRPGGQPHRTQPAHCRVPARQGRSRLVAIRHEKGRLCDGSRVGQSLAVPQAPQARGQLRRHRWRRVQAALPLRASERVGDVVRCAERECGARTQPRGQDGRVFAQHGRGWRLPLPPGARRRPGLERGHWLLWLPRARRLVRPTAICRHSGHRIDQDGGDQALAGGQAGARWHPAEGQDHPRDRRGARHRHRSGLPLAACTLCIQHTTRDDALHREIARALGRQAGGVQAVRGPAG
mmetsp:Transcript_9037/g.23374  ORF Transcript_9037/g.23374 Transcript_9037/m.23374 type:complete len:279 (+) Transcript_9037:261-1097(+)